MKPLEGIKILDFTQAHAGSAATMILADMGAEVIKIERFGVGDMARYWEPMKDEKSAYYAYLNRGKKSISIDASSEKGKEIIEKLIASVDVIAENFKLGSMERMGFSYEEVRKINPKVIYASLNGFGQSGVLKNNIGLDLQLQAMSGAMDLTGAKEGIPIKIGAAFGDHVSGNYMTLGILSALVEREKTGKGKRIDIAILDSLFGIMPEQVLEESMDIGMNQQKTQDTPNIPADKICSISEVVENEKKSGGLVFLKDKALGGLWIPASPYIFSDEEQFLTSSPLQGENTVYYLKKLGYDTFDIQMLLDENIVEIAESEV